MEIAGRRDRHPDPRRKLTVLVAGAGGCAVVDEDDERIADTFGRRSSDRRAEGRKYRLERSRLQPAGGGDRLERFAGSEQVSQTRRRPQVVLEHAEPAVRRADEVRPGDVGGHRAGSRAGCGHRRLIPVGLTDQTFRDHPGGDDASLPVDVGDEGIQRPHPLDHPALDPLPLSRGDDPRDHVDVERMQVFPARTAEHDPPPGQLAGDPLGLRPEPRQTDAVDQRRVGARGRIALVERPLAETSG